MSSYYSGKNKLLGRVHIALKASHLDEGGYRELLQEKFGVTSAKYLNIGQLKQLAAHLEGKQDAPLERQVPRQKVRLDKFGRIQFVYIPEDDEFASQKRKIIKMVQELGWSWEYLNTMVRNLLGWQVGTMLQMCEAKQVIKILNVVLERHNDMELKRAGN